MVTRLKHKEAIHEKVSRLELPQLPQVLIQLIDVCRAEEVDIRLVAQTVAQDISITTKTLQLANSAFLGARSQFKNIDQAVIFLGVDTVRNLAISVSVHNVFGSDTEANSDQLDSEKFWYHSLLTALISKTVAEKSGYDAPGTAYLTGLLHDTGKYLLHQHFGEDYRKLIDSQSNTHNVVDEEEKTFGLTHCDAGKWLLDNWKLSENFGIAIRDHHNRDSEDATTSVLGRILRLANALAKQTDEFDEQTLKDALILCISPSSLATIVIQEKETLEEVAQSLGIKIKEPDSYDQGAHDKNDQKRLKDKVTLRAKLYGFMDNIIQAQSINRVFLALEESLSLLFNCDETVLLLPNQLNDTLVVQGSSRNTVAQKLREQNFSLAVETKYVEEKTGNHLLLITTNKAVVLSVNENNASLNTIFQTITKDFLLAVPVRISRDHQGLLLLGLDPSNDSIKDEEETLQLLSSHVGNRLYQEILREEYATAFAKERITAVEEIAQSIAHEISNPLGVIQNYIYLLAEKNENNPQMSKDLSTINNEIERIANISSQLNELSLPPQPAHNTHTDINQVILEIVDLFQNSIPSQANISIDFAPPTDIPLVWMEINPLKQIIGNLLTNSIDALEDKGKIEINCHLVPQKSLTNPGEVVITVSDNGPGIPPAIVNTIFRAGKTTKEDGHAGLGLAIVNRLTKDLSGRIYHSTGKQGNTQFTLHLPIIHKPNT
ncbi:MAG: HD-like signal output (HDOD) protein/signal transduction histidine kinase [Desulforhopalus sp.]